MLSEKELNKEPIYANITQAIAELELWHKYQPNLLATAEFKKNLKIRLVSSCKFVVNLHFFFSSADISGDFALFKEVNCRETLKRGLLKPLKDLYLKVSTDRVPTAVDGLIGHAKTIQEQALCFVNFASFGVYVCDSTLLCVYVCSPGGSVLGRRLVLHNLLT